MNESRSLGDWQKNDGPRSACTCAARSVAVVLNLAEIAAPSIVHGAGGVTTMNIKHSALKALGAMSLLVVAGTVAMLLFR